MQLVLVLLTITVSLNGNKLRQWILEKSYYYLADQLLPFDITIVGIPEYGNAYAKRLIIHGVEIMTEASGTSIDDLVIEKQNSFIARERYLMKRKNEDVYILTED